MIEKIVCLKIYNALSILALGIDVALTLPRAELATRKKRAIGSPFADFGIDVNAVPTVSNHCR